MDGSIYTCELVLNNPNGLNNFVTIDGVHLDNKTDTDVRKISQKSGSNSTNSPSIICEKFANLEQLIMQFGKIRSLDEFSLKSCKNINFANFYGNGMNQVHENAFIENMKLQKLYFYNNYLTSLPENVFKNQQHLQVLWLDSNRFTDFPLNIFKPLINLVELDLRNNQILTLKVEWFAPLKNLQILYLMANKIVTLPVNIFGSLGNMKTLNLNSNKLEIINSNSFGTIQRLSSINLSNNQIVAIDKKFIENNLAPSISFFMMVNLCSNYSSNSNVNKTMIKQSIEQCMQNFDSIMGTTCSIEDPTAELCDIKDKIGAFQGNLTNIVQSAFDLINYQRDRITKNENDIRDLKATVNQQQLNLQDKDVSIAEIRGLLNQIQTTGDSNAIFAEIQNIKANIDFLLSRPCPCT